MGRAELDQVYEHYAGIRPEGARQIVPLGVNPVKIYWYFPSTDEAILILFDASSMREISCERVSAEEARRLIKSSRAISWGVL
jgi:hypothetical protein